MIRHLSPTRAKMLCTALLLVSALTQAQSLSDDSEILENQSSNTSATFTTNKPSATKTAKSNAKRGWRLRFDLSQVNPSGTIVSANTERDSGIGFDVGFGAGLRGEYQFTERFGVEFGVLSTGEVDFASGLLTGRTRSGLGVSSFTPTTMGLNIHLTPNRPVDLYVGPLLALVGYSNISLWADSGAAGASVSIDDDVGWGAILGFDVPFGDRGWMVQANVRYINTDMRDSGETRSFNSKFDPVIFSLGVGYRF